MGGELDRVIDQLEAAEMAATDLLDRYTDILQTAEPWGSSWGVTRYRKIMRPAGSRLNYVAALKQVRDLFRTWPTIADEAETKPDKPGR